MNYEIKYHLTNKNIDSDKYVFIYDFGDMKGFFYDNEFKLFKILNKDFKENMYTEYCVPYEQIPLKAISIEKYYCKYENNSYLIPNYSIQIIPFFQPSFSQQSPPPPLLPLPQSSDAQPSAPQLSAPRPSEPVSQPLHKKQTHKKQTHTKENLKKSAAYPSQVSEKTQQGLMSQQPLLQPPKNQWMSLEQIMKHSLSLVPQEPSLQHAQVNQSSLVLKKKAYQHLRQPQKKVQKLFQDSKSQDFLQVENS